MSISTDQALRALAARIRSQYGFEYDESALIQKDVADQIKQSKDDQYLRFFSIYEREDQPSISGHPDYDYLAEPPNIGETENGEITTLFMDLRNFTKYCLFLERELVYRAKAAAIAAVSDVSRMSGAHIHDIPGDGVIAFFGGKSADHLDASTRGIAAACLSMALLEDYVIPEFNDDDRFPSIFPKIGLDYGEVTWGAFGAPPVFEVKATSFYVDIASKMMAELLSREMAVGNSFKEHLDIDEKYVEEHWKYTRELTVQGEGRKVEYQTWKLKWRKFLEDKLDQDRDLTYLTVTGLAPGVTVSRSRLEDAPLA